MILTWDTDMAQYCFQAAKFTRLHVIAMAVRFGDLTFLATTPKRYRASARKSKSREKGPVFYGNSYSKKMSILVVRINSKGELCESKPCCMCIYMAKMYGISRYYYSNDDGNICCEKVSDMDPDHTSMGLQMMVDRRYAKHARHEPRKLPVSRRTKRRLHSKKHLYDKHPKKT
jgi:hypothetical protein